MSPRGLTRLYTILGVVVRSLGLLLSAGLFAILVYICVKFKGKNGWKGEANTTIPGFIALPCAVITDVGEAYTSLQFSSDRVGIVLSLDIISMVIGIGAIYWMLLSIFQNGNAPAGAESDWETMQAMGCNVLEAFVIVRGIFIVWVMAMYLWRRRETQQRRRDASIIPLA